MYTLTFLTRRRPGLTLEEFVEHYRTVHLELAARLPRLISYQQSLLAHEDQAWSAPEAYPTHDALSVYSFASHEDARAAFDSEAGRALDADTGTFIDWPSVVALPAHTTHRYDA